MNLKRWIGVGWAATDGKPKFGPTVIRFRLPLEIPQRSALSIFKRVHPELRNWDVMADTVPQEAAR